MLKGFPDLPPVWTLGAALAAWALGRWVPVGRVQADLVATAILAAGVALILWAAAWFFFKRTPIEPGHTPRALITEGPYRLNRNPIYTGFVAIVAGVGLAQGALSALVPAALLPWILTRRFVRAEEDALRRAFGAEAEAWLAATRRWI